MINKTTFPSRENLRANFILKTAFDYGLQKLILTADFADKQAPTPVQQTREPGNKLLELIRISGFGFLSGFGLRNSDFRLRRHR